jgi:hypothetical protein
VVRQDGEISGLQQVAKVTHGLVDRQELTVVGAEFLLHWTEFSGKESEGLPDALHSLLGDGTHGSG